ncbi:MAG: acetylxylan esterase [Verrucomicrobiales bacterium]
MKSLVAYVCLVGSLAASAADVRLEPPKDLDGYFPWSPPASAEAWGTRSRRVREQTLATLGLWPLPTRSALNAVIHGAVERDDYTVERVIFESAPGFFVTGSLYRPKAGVGATGPDGRRAGVLCPHGHWSNGRFMEESEAGVKREIDTGAEGFADAAHSPLQARCVHLARMGCIVLHYDMLGYADSVQIGMDVAHGFRTQRPDMNAADGWGLFSPRAEGWYQSVMGLQTWNSIRALDFLESLPDVDPRRIGVTGASGGGTQTFVLAAVDHRPSAVFPAVMVSTAMQGGCTCENASGFRVGTGNIELAALFAPKPMMLSSADDWTKEIARKGFPELRSHWERLGAPDHIALHDRTEFGHNYNAPSRAAMYAWFNQHLGLGLPAHALVERDFRRLNRSELTVWTPDHPAPTDDAVGPALEKRLLQLWKSDAAEQLTARPELATTGWNVVLGRTLAAAGNAFSWDEPTATKADRGDYLELRGTVANATHREEVSATFLYPKNWNGDVVLWLDGTDTPSAECLAEVRAGRAVALSRLFAPDRTANPLVKNPRQAPAYTYGYNHPLFAQRVHDTLTLIQFCRTRDQYPARSIRLVARGPAATIGTATAFLGKSVLAAATVDPTDFRFDSLSDFRDAAFLPGALKYGDLPGLRHAAGLP